MSKLYELFHSVIAKLNKAIKTEAQTLTDEEKAQARSNIGVVQPDLSQNDPTAADFVKNRTHYEEVVEVGGDTLTWDGNTEGLVSTTCFGVPCYKVSEAILTENDIGEDAFMWLANGVGLVKDDGIVQFTFNGIIGGADGMFLAVPNDNFVLDDGEGNVINIPEKGVYFGLLDGNYPTSLHIPNYTGFITKETVVHKIEPKFLPDALQFGEGYGDTLTIDVAELEEKMNNGTAVIASEMWLKVSDAIVTESDLANGVTVTTNEGVVNIAGGEIGALVPGIYAFPSFEVIFVTEEGAGVDVDGIAFPETGVYMKIQALVIAESITINNYTGFTRVQKLDEKYMPEKYLPASEYLQPDWEQTDETAKDFIKNKPDNEVVHLSAVENDGVGRLVENGNVITRDRLNEIINSGQAITLEIANVGCHCLPTCYNTTMSVNNCPCGFVTALVVQSVSGNTVSLSSHKVYYTAEYTPTT